MSFVERGYEWDIFVSYSHGRPAPGETQSRLKQWTEAFVASLSEDLHYALSGQVAHAYDPNLNPVHPANKSEHPL